MPEDVSVIGIGDTDFAQTYDPPLTVLRTPTDEVAAQAVEMLLSRLAAKGDASLPPRKALIQFDLILRESCAPVARH